MPLGAITDLYGGWIDYELIRIIDVLSSIPMMLFCILLLVALGARFGNIIIAMALTGWIGIARLVRGEVLSLKKANYVRAARLMGAGTRHIITRHLIHNALTPVIVSVALGVPCAMFAEASLGGLSLGIASPQASWGQMIGLYQGEIQTSWHPTVFAELVLALTLLASFQIADGLCDARDSLLRT